MSYEGKTYLVLGVSGGIGAYIAEALIQRGAQVIGVCRGNREVPAGIDYFQGDCSSFSGAEAVFKAIQEKYPKVDGIVNAIGSVVLKAAHLTDEKTYLETIHTNLTSAFLTVKFGVPLIGQNGSIVLFSSCAAKIGLPNHEVIASAKGGVQGLTLSAAATYAPKNIRVNSIAPGLVETPATEMITHNEISRNASMKLHPLNHFGSPEDIADAVLWLLEPKTQWITGQVISLDGGLATIKR